MPIYEYQCASCHHAFELIQKVNDDVAKTCEQCGQDTAVRLVSAPGFQLKGTGWYATDFKDKPKSKPNEASDHSASDDKTSSDDPKSAEKKTEVDKKTTAETKTRAKTTVTTGTGESD